MSSGPAATAAVAVPPAQASTYRLVFNDTFDTLDLGRSGSGAHTWYPGVWFYHDHPSTRNISAANSMLTLRWRSGQNSSHTSISSFSPRARRNHAWQYGYFEARMKWDVANGAWPAFWLIPVEDADGLSTDRSRRESGEIDIFEGQGDHPHTYYGTVHDWVNLHSTANEDNHFALAQDANLSEFHVYGMLWTPGRVSWYLDNHLLHTENTPAVLDRQHFYLVLSMQEGVNWTPGNVSGVGRSQIALDVDWVHVWQR